VADVGAFASDCVDMIVFTHADRANRFEPLITRNKYSLGILALCVSGVRVSTHVSHKLIHAVEHAQVKHGESLCVGEFESTLFFFAK